MLYFSHPEDDPFRPAFAGPAVSARIQFNKSINKLKTNMTLKFHILSDYNTSAPASQYIVFLCAIRY
ncbi:hypothetical protein C4J81_03540 [Deltaproteobacteria bacterium Smac51]|nr:hypothetical protein C4J81_03540 [Deltaproteobacteria bacterium Smac51]